MHLIVHLYIVQGQVGNVNIGALSSYAELLQLHNPHFVAQPLELARKAKTQARFREVRRRKRRFHPPSFMPQAWSQVREHWVWRYWLGLCREERESSTRKPCFPAVLSVHRTHSILPSLPPSDGSKDFSEVAS